MTGLPRTWAVISCGGGAYRAERLQEGQLQPEGTVHMAATGAQAKDMARLLESRDRIQREAAQRATLKDSLQVPRQEGLV